MVYRHYKVAEGKKWLPLIDHIARNELKYSARVAKFVQRTGELVSELERTLKEITVENRKVKVIRWLRAAEEKWEIAIIVLQAIREGEGVQSGPEPWPLREFIVGEGL